MSKRFRCPELWMLWAVLLLFDSSHTSLVFAEEAGAWPEKVWANEDAADVGLDADLLKKARDYALTGGGSGYITRHGKLVMSWGDVKQRYDLKSTTKSIGVTALGLAIADGKIELADKAKKHHPSLGTPPKENADKGWIDTITIQHLATQTAGFEKPGGYQKLVFQPGTKWHYSDGGPNWLAECVTLVYRRDVNDLMFDRVFTPLGITTGDLRWRNNSYRPREIDGIARREFGSGISANVDAMARIGLLYLREGKWKNKQIIPAEFVRLARTTVPDVVGIPEHKKRFDNASDHYGLLWWNNADGTLDGVPRNAYWSWGLYDSLIVVMPDQGIVVSRAGKSWKRDGGWTAHYDVLKPFLGPIAASVDRKSAQKNSETKFRAAVKIETSAPYPPSPIIASIEWAPRDTIVRKARGGDNWPITWADDGNLYTAYGDGNGFKPNVPKKLSMGFAKIIGSPSDFEGINIRSPTGEKYGGGSNGEKVSGMLMVDDVLYMFARNAGNSQLAWSTDYAKTWTWADWKFTTSFGYPTFLNYGKNNEGARDEFVYVYSADSDSAYKAADQMVLARVPKDRIKQRDAYEFFVRLDNRRSPVWSMDVGKRGPVFTHSRKCYRTGISYNAGLQRYLWCQILPAGSGSKGPRFEGGFGIYDAPEPWGPWTTAYFTERWDVGPGETSSLPTKWMSDEGTQIHLVFSGDDCFSVRRGTITKRSVPR